MKVFHGQEVRFQSLQSAHVFYGKVLRTIGDRAVVEDRSGLPPRVIDMDRLEPLSGRGIFAGRSG